jgi:outer membrane usher protein
MLLALGLAWPGELLAEEAPATDDDTALTADEVPATEPDPSVPAAGEAPAFPTVVLPEGYTPLQLDVKINDTSTGLIAAFFQLPDRTLASTRGELKELGIAAQGEGKTDELVQLADIKGLTYVFDDAEQLINIRLDANSRIRKEINASARPEALAAESGNGVLLNYGLFTALNTDYGFSEGSISSVSAHLDARAFTSKLGTLELSGIIATPNFKAAETTRLDTTWSYENPGHLMEYKLGDVISGGTNWSRPVRLGGGQIRRNFGLRSDLITMPLPYVDGSAGVPSTLDVYIDGMRAYSRELDEGPFRIDNIPVFTNEARARVVLTDAAGREVEAEGEFFTSPDLLRPGLFDFSAEIGFLRERYGAESFDYSDYPVAIANMRYGLTELLTAESHAEFSEDLQNGGIGFLAAIPNFGTLNAAFAGSLHDGDTGFLVYGSWEKRWGNVQARLSAARTIGDYQDLASINSFELSGKHDGGVSKALEQVSLSYAMPDYDASFGVSLVHSLNAMNERDLILSGGVSKTYGHINLFGSGFYNFAGSRDYGLSIGLSMPLGRNLQASAFAIKTKGNYELASDISKPHIDSEYSTAWRVAAAKKDELQLEGRGELRTPVGTANATVQLLENGAGGTLAYDGAVVGTKSGIMFGRHVSDSFAIIETGVPGVTVRHENRYVGKTGRNGQLLVDSVVPYASNKFDIDLDALPLTAQMPESEKHIVPRSKTGVLVDFKVTDVEKAAIVKLTHADGTFISTSTEIMLDGNPEAFIMGYDGEVYITGLAEKNGLVVKLPSGECRIEFDYVETTDEQPFIGPFTCA